MENGLAHEGALVETIQSAGGCPTITTAQAIREAFTHFAIKKLVLISPYVKQTNEHEVHYLTEAGFTVLHELGLGLESDGYSAVTPEEWIDRQGEYAAQRRRVFPQLYEHAYDRSDQ